VLRGREGPSIRVPPRIVEPVVPAQVRGHGGALPGRADRDAKPGAGRYPEQENQRYEAPRRCVPAGRVRALGCRNLPQLRGSTFRGVAVRSRRREPGCHFAHVGDLGTVVWCRKVTASYGGDLRVTSRVSRTRPERRPSRQSRVLGRAELPISHISHAASAPRARCRRRRSPRHPARSARRSGSRAAVLDVEQHVRVLDAALELVRAQEAINETTSGP